MKENLAEIVEKTKAKVDKIDSEIDYLKKEQYKYGGKNDNHKI